MKPVILLLTVVSALKACAAGPRPHAEAPRPDATAGDVPARSEPALRVSVAPALELRPASAPQPAPVELAPARGLDPGAVEGLLATLPPLRPPSPDPASVGPTPPEAAAPPPADAALVVGASAAQAPARGSTLTVVARLPQGEAAAARRLGLVLSAPVAGAGGPPPPIDIAPPLAGRWRWLGDRALVFEPSAPLPAASTFEVRLPEGLTGAAGEPLAAPAPWVVSTPAPRLVARLPGDDPVPAGAPVLLGFDRPVDPAAIASALSLRADGVSVPVVPLSTEEILADASLAERVAGTEARRWFAWRPASPLPQGATVTVTVAPAPIAAAGPRPLPAPLTFAYRTLPPLTVVRQRCGFGVGCRAGDAWSLELSEPVAAATVRGLTVSPALPGRSVTVRDRWIEIRGAAEPGVRYEVRLPATLRDRRGRALGLYPPLTFSPGPAAPSLAAPGGDVVTLAPAADGPPIFRVESAGHGALAVRAYRVTPADWPAWLDLVRARRRPGAALSPPGALAFSRTIAVPAPHDRVTVVPIDLSEGVGEGGRAQLVVVAQPAASGEAAAGPATQAVARWVQITGIALDTWADADELVVLATDRAAGEPLCDVALALSPGPAAGRTGADGIARLELPPVAARQLLVATRGADVAILPDRYAPWGPESPWTRRDPAPRLAWHVVTEGDGARPGERLVVRGRVATLGQAAGGPPARLESLRWRLTPAAGRRVAAGAVAVDRGGAFTVALDVPQRAPSGPAILRLDARDVGGLEGVRYEHPVLIGRGEGSESTLRLTATEAKPGAPPLITAEAPAELGGAGALVRWRAEARGAAVRPPGYPTFHFGARPAWWSSQAAPSDPPPRRATTPLSADRTASVALEGVGAPGWRAASVSAEIGGAASRVEVQLPGAQVQVGVRPASNFVTVGEPLGVSVVVVDAGGAPVAGRPVAVNLLPLTGGAEGAVRACALTSGAAPVTCELRPAVPGPHRLVAAASDLEGRRSRAVREIWAVGAAGSAVGGASPHLRLVPDKDAYRPGEDARLLVVSPDAAARGVLTLERDGIVAVEPFEIAGAAAILTVGLRASHAPGVAARVALLEPSVGAAALELPVAGPALAVSLDAPAEAGVGAAVDVAVAVGDDQGRPLAAAEVLLWQATSPRARLEALDPRPALAPWRRPGVRWRGSRQGPIAAWLPAVRAAGSHARAVAEENGASGWRRLGEPSRTDERGRLVAQVAAPDAPGPLRLAAVAVGDRARFGVADATVTLTRPVEVRVAAPDLWRVGDRGQARVTLISGLDAEVEVALAARGRGLAFLEGAGRAVTLPARGEAVVALPVVAEAAGDAVLEVAARAPGARAQARHVVAVEAPRRGRVVVGTLGERAARVPVDLEAGDAVDVALSSSPLLLLAGDLEALLDPRFDDSEVRAARVLAWAALGGDVDQVIPPSQALEARVLSDLVALQAAQNDDGGFGRHARGEPSRPALSVAVAEALVRAAQAGLPVAEEAIARARRYLLQRSPWVLGSEADGPRRTLAARALYVRDLMGDDVAEEAGRIVGAAGVDAAALAWALPILEGERGTRRAARAARARLEAWAAAGEGAEEVQVVALAALSPRGDGDVVAALAQRVLDAASRGAITPPETGARRVQALAAWLDVSRRPGATVTTWLGEVAVDRHELEGAPGSPRRLTLKAGPAADAVTLAGDPGDTAYFRVSPVAPASTAAPAEVMVAQALEGDRRLGSRVRLRVTATTAAPWSRLALHAPLPAGLVPLAVDVETSDAVFTHRAIRGQAAEAFAEAVPAGVHEIVVLARVAWPGRYSWPAAEARAYAEGRVAVGRSEPVSVTLE